MAAVEPPLGLGVGAAGCRAQGGGQYLFHQVGWGYRVRVRVGVRPAGWLQPWTRDNWGAGQVGGPLLARLEPLQCPLDPPAPHLLTTVMMSRCQAAPMPLPSLVTCGGGLQSYNRCPVLTLLPRWVGTPSAPPGPAQVVVDIFKGLFGFLTFLKGFWKRHFLRIFRGFFTV